MVVESQGSGFRVFGVFRVFRVLRGFRVYKGVKGGFTAWSLGVAVLNEGFKVSGLGGL